MTSDAREREAPAAAAFLTRGEAVTLLASCSLRVCVCVCVSGCYLNVLPVADMVSGVWSFRERWC